MRRFDVAYETSTPSIWPLSAEIGRPYYVLFVFPPDQNPSINIKSKLKQPKTNRAQRTKTGNRIGEEHRTMYYTSTKKAA